ncbi:hypothetical protein GCM10027290_18930 [Micromonospora sonneratiae]|uniref:TOMM leader peptide-binding protein n=1 Tax=Micromonospora sonneratiae TaxID=1184706 RepID=A0ABW3Y895_9ACTN
MIPPPELADIWGMRPKLRHDVVFLDAPAGAYLRGPDTAFVLKGRTAFRWLSTLGPYLDGRHTVEQICASLDPGQRQTVATLIRALTARGVAKDARHRTQLPEAVARAFAGQIEFIDHFVDDPAGRFQLLRDAHVVLGGSGQTLLATATNLLRNGCATITLHPQDEPAPYRDALRPESERLSADGVETTVKISDQPLDISDAAAVVYCAEPDQLAPVLAVTRRCHSAGTPLIPVVWQHGRAVLGPTTAGGAAPCWLCAQLRITANADPTAAAEAWRQLAIGPMDGASDPVDEVSAQMVGNAAAFEVFRVLTGALPPETVSSVVLLDTATLESTRERVLPHPGCPVCRDAPTSVATDGPGPYPTNDQAGSRSASLPAEAELTDEAKLTDEEVYQQAEVLVSPNAGLFTRFVDDPLEQAPLKVARLRVPGVAGPREITAFDVDTVMGARLGAYRSAIRDYVGRIADRREAVTASADELIRSGRRPVPWSELVTTTAAVPYRTGRRISWLPARVLGTDEPVWVPAAVALPLSPANRDRYAERTPAGAVVGVTGAELVAAGLTSALAYRALVDVTRGRAEISPIAESALAADDDLALAVKAGRRFGETIQVYALTGARPAHAVLATTGGSTDSPPLWTVGAGLTARQAQLTAVRDLVGLVQVRHFEHAEADLGDPLLADFDPRTIGSSADAAAETDGPPSGADTTSDEILAALADQGLTALLVDTTTPDIGTTQALRAGVVLLWRRGAAIE